MMVTQQTVGPLGFNTECYLLRAHWTLILCAGTVCIKLQDNIPQIRNFSTTKTFPKVVRKSRRLQISRILCCDPSVDFSPKKESKLYFNFEAEQQYLP